MDCLGLHFNHLGQNNKIIWGFPCGSVVKEPACQCRRLGFDPWLGKIPWRRKWQPTPVFLPWTEVFIEPFNFSFFSITGWGIDLDYCDTEWFALETKRDHPVVFEIASKYCISDSFVDYDGYSISSKGFLPTVVDIMVI